MAGSTLLQRIINTYSKKTNKWEIKFSQLLDFINNLLINDESGRYSVFSTNTPDVLTAMLIDLDESGACKLSYSGTSINTIKNYGYLNQAVQSAYQHMESNSEYPFPTFSSLNIKVPEDRLKTLHLPDGLSIALREDVSDEDVIYKLFFSGDSSPIIAEGGIIRSRMLVLAVSKIRNFLTFKNNANFMYQKMLPAFKKNTRALMDSIKMVQSNPGRASIAIKKPDEFVFSFWTQMCSFLRKDLSGKENMTTTDEGLLQSSVLIHSYILYYKNIIISNKRKQEALKFVGEKLKKEPFYFTISDIYSFQDKNGLLLDKKYKRDDLHDFINGKLQLKNNEVLPELIKVKTVNNKLYYIHKSVFLTLVHKKVGDAHDYYRKEYLDQWTASIRSYRSPKEMNSDEAFHADLEKRVREEDPLLYALLGYELLYLAISDSRNVKLKAVAQGYLDMKMQESKPLPVILNLRRRNLTSEVRSIVPFWLTIGFFRKLAAVFGSRKKRKRTTTSLKAQMGGSGSHPASTAKVISVQNAPLKKGGSRTKAAEYKKSVDILKQKMNYSSVNVNERLKDLSGEWNPLLDHEARINLVKDVNNMVRDYMRKILRETAFAVPDAERVKNIADLLAGNKAFTVIKKRDSFKTYITVYILKILSETKP
ncbi:MAG: hypothetical protein PQJ61_10155 [Spirochaetales bacterium]|uniref:Uncharacterized protein n=1 Tax=Candidatus Thalassospirochaeta sargassi TaxID=3119039 RepID=A0AAJ1IFL4_9SPIO|nr:hypothetical protein [Spirochaetales bacterium]